MPEVDIELYDDETVDVEVDDVIQNGGGGGTTNYNLLTNKPKINNVELSGNKSLSDLGITTAIADEVEDYVDEHRAELKGDPGTNGTNGVDGFSPTASVSQTLGGAVVTITDRNGTTTATISNGVDGQNGQDGANGSDGFSPVATVTQTSTGATVTVTDRNGTTSAVLTNGQNGTNGSDYVITEDDYEEIAIRVYDMFTDAESVSV